MADPQSYMLMCFGQSNADVHDAGPRLAEEAENSYPIFMPNDGKCVRGHMGRPRVTPITGFAPISDAPSAVQSILAPAAARILHDMQTPPDRVIVRSEARGGRSFLGFERNGDVVDGIFRNPCGGHSIIFTNLITTMKDSIAAAHADGCPITLINMVWLHGEADRAMARDAYSDLFLEFIDTVETLMAPEGVALHWTLVQPSGTGPVGGGNFWPNRLSLFDVADERDNVDVGLAAYAYGQYDGAHYSADGKLRMGENLGRAIAKRLQEDVHIVPRPVGAQLVDDAVVLTFDVADDLILDTQTNPLPDGTVLGFHTRDNNRAVLQAVRVVSDDQILLQFDQAPDPASLAIHYAYKHNRRSDAVTDVMCPAGRGCLRTAKAVPSCLREDAVLHDWAAAFSTRFDELAS